MIIVKVINQKIVQIALAQQSNALTGTIFAARNKKQIANFARHLVQTTSNSQKVTNTNNQQLIPIARNISFRQCYLSDVKHSSETNSKVSFSMTASSPTAHYITTQIDQPFYVGHDDNLAVLGPIIQKTKDAAEKKETKTKYYRQSFDESLTTTSERKLVVLMSWLEAKEKHIEKYRRFYLDHGFDVLNVKTSPLDILLPNIGARKISEDFIRFMAEKQYSNVVLHGFSVGGYMFGRLLVEVDKLEANKKNQLLDSIRGVLFDSIVPYEGICVGIANSISRNKFVAKFLENVLRLYLVLGHRIATKYFLEVSEKVWAGPLRCPTLFMMSKDDIISDFRVVERLESTWKDLGIATRKFVVESSPHVQIFNKHHQAYKEEVESFLNDIKMI